MHLSKTQNHFFVNPYQSSNTENMAKKENLLRSFSSQSDFRTKYGEMI